MSEMFSKITSLPPNFKMPLAHLEFEQIDVKTYSNHQHSGYVKKIGGVFLKGLSQKRLPKKENIFGLTPNHGRVAATSGPKKTAILIKGIGWTLGGPQVLLSEKDDELCFGLYDEESALREIAVSEYIEDLAIPATRVIGYARINDQRLAKVKFSSGKPISPCLLYTKAQSLLRVSDLIYFDPKQKRELILYICIILGIEPKKYFDWFCVRLGKTIGMLHEAGGCNDTLDWSNITLAGEITDFEWIYVPKIPLPWGDGETQLFERRDKEIIYAFEICTKLYYLLQSAQKTSNSKIITSLESGYNKYTKEKRNVFDKLKKRHVFEKLSSP
jgi:hypothetical protein